MRVRPTRKAAGLAAGALLCFFIGSNIQSGWLYVLGASMMGVVAAGTLMAPLSIRNLRAVRKMPDRGSVGEVLGVVLQIDGSGPGYFAGVDAAAGARTPFLLRGARSSTISYAITLPRRGVFEEGNVEVTSGFPFGMARAVRSLEVPSALVVHPRVVALGNFPLLEAASTPGESLHDRRRRGSGMEFFGIRDHRFGDSLRHVAWRASARRGTLLVREYEEEPAARLGIFIDAGALAGEEPDTTLEAGISAAASLALYALDSGHPVQLFSGGESLDQGGARETLDWLAAIEAGSGGLGSAVESSLGRVESRSTNVLIFPTLRPALEQAIRSTSHLQTLGTRVVAMMVSARSFAETAGLSLQEEDAAAGELASVHALVYRISRSRALEECLEAPWLA